MSPLFRAPFLTRREVEVMRGDPYDLAATDAERARQGLPLWGDDVHGGGWYWACGDGVDATYCAAGPDVCGAAGHFLCDAPMGEGKTCDLPICPDHRWPIGVDLDLCPIHAAQWNFDTGGVGVVVRDFVTRSQAEEEKPE